MCRWFDSGSRHQKKSGPHGPLFFWRSRNRITEPLARALTEEDALRPTREAGLTVRAAEQDTVVAPRGTPPSSDRVITFIGIRFLC